MRRTRYLVALAWTVSALLSCSPHQDDGPRGDEADTGGAHDAEERYSGHLLGEWSKPTSLVSLQPKTSFDDIVGAGHAKRILSSIATMLREQKGSAGLLAHRPKGVLLAGPAGVGKSKLAHATALAAERPLLVVQADQLSSDVLSSVSSSSGTLRSAFDQARKQAPIVLLLEDVESIFSHVDGAKKFNDEMDLLPDNGDVLVIATLHQGVEIDRSVMQSGRLNPMVLVDLPSRQERRDWLAHLTADLPHDADVDLDALNEELAYQTAGSIEGLVRAAGSQAVVAGRSAITAADYEQALDAAMLGPESHSYPPDEPMRWRTALHEAGHAVMATLLDSGHRVRKVSLIPRMYSEGVTLYTPSEPLFSMTHTRLVAMLAIAQAGFLAEQHFLPDGPGAGSGSDLLQAQLRAREAVLAWGFADRGAAGPLGRGLGLIDSSIVGNGLKDKIDNEVDALLSEASALANHTLEGEGAKAFLLVAEALFAQGEMKGADVRAMCAPYVDAAREATRTLPTLEELRRYAGDKIVADRHESPLPDSFTVSQRESLAAPPSEVDPEEQSSVASSEMGFDELAFPKELSESQLTGFGSDSTDASQPASSLFDSRAADDLSFVFPELR